MLALVACLALTAAAANGAQAALNWNIAGSSLGAGSETVTIGTDGSGWELNGTTLGTTIELRASGLQCASTCKIEGAVESSGKLKFTGVTVMKPAGCSAGNPGQVPGTITTNALVDQVEMDEFAGSTVVFDQFSPASRRDLRRSRIHPARVPALRNRDSDHRIGDR
jgi:hypothetical protein